MRRLTSIVAVNAEGVIGHGNALPWRVRSDMRFFKERTSQNVVVMGRKTYDSLGCCLPNRYNVVVSHQLALFQDSENCVLRYGIGEALAAAEDAPLKYGEVFVVGGATMYDQFSTLVDRYLITIVEKPVQDGDAFFDQRIIDDAGWSMTELASGQANDQGDEAAFTIFELIASDSSERMARRQKLLDEFRSKVKVKRQRARTTTNFESSADFLPHLAFGT